MTTHTGKSISGRGPDRRRKASALATGSTALLVTAMIAGGAGLAYAKGGTAKPPGGGGGGGGVPPPANACPSGAPSTSACIVPPAGPVLPNFPATGAALSGNGSNGFSITGFVQNVTANCNSPTAGGTVTVNGITIQVPSDSIIQYPANTLTWTDAVCGVSATNPPIALDGTGGTTAPIHPGVEISVDGNITTSNGAAPGPTPAAGVGTPYVAGIIHISQQSVNSGSGYIQSINYGTGAIVVRSNGGQTIQLMLNDPKGRFGRPMVNSDARFSVDDANPTIKSGATGYPMCVPRAIDPVSNVAYTVTGGIPDDPRCPQKNRPQTTCRNFGSAGIAFRVPGVDLPTTPPAGTTYCTGFVMKAVAGMPGTPGLAATQLAAISADTVTGDPDPREMAPFEIGDFIIWSGTLVNTGNPATDIIWVHTIDANVGIYTQPATLPAYIAVGESGLGVNPEPSTAAALAGVEATARIFLEASTTDIASIVDIYLDDKGFGLPPANAPAGPIVPMAGAEYFRWITPESMTGTLADQTLQTGKGVIIPPSSIAQAGAFGGGIYTQFIGPQPGRARIRANKVPAINPTLACPATGATVAGTRGCAVTQSPTRYFRVVLRSLCAPAASAASSEAGFAAVATVPSNNLSTAVPATSGLYYSINGSRALLPQAATPPYNGTAGGGIVLRQGGNQCLESAQYANGLFTGQYMAPVGEYIFPENTLAGFPAFPFNFWHMGFMAYGENGRDGNSTAPIGSVDGFRPW